MQQSIRKTLVPVALGSIVVSMSTLGLAHSDGIAKATTLAVYGDAPYGTTPADTSELDATRAFVDAINADPDVDLVVHVGDIHSGKQ